MKIRIYEKDELLFFPIYASTIDYNNAQSEIKRKNGRQCLPFFLLLCYCGIPLERVFFFSAYSSSLILRIEIPRIIPLISLINIMIPKVTTPRTIRRTPVLTFPCMKQGTPIPFKMIQIIPKAILLSILLSPPFRCNLLQ